MSSVISALLGGVYIPKMARVRQRFPRPQIKPEAIPETIFQLLEEDKFSEKIQPGMSVCITAGSRGIANIALITRTLVEYCIKRGAKPFIVPAMGSHGGALAEGQREILAALGITEETMGCPIRATMETVKVGETEEGHSVRIDKYAAAADAIIVSCRIKPHTGFRGPYESGIMKMMAIGLGKQEGAEACHGVGAKHMARMVPMFGRVIRDNAPIAFALATIENAYDETAKLIALTPDEFDEMEPVYLKEAFANMPRLLFDSCDLLIVDWIGKNISGDGMDPNVTGAFGTPYASGGIDAKRICALRLTEESHHSAVGMGLADAISKKLWEQVDLDVTYPNAITSTVLEPVKIPPIMENDRLAIQLCLHTANEMDRNAPRIIRISNTLSLEHIMVSEAMLEEAKRHSDITIEGVPEELQFDEEGNLL
ncbi:MAG TPA: DUF2088 domain-containing protein [Candidatus Merdisoma merdipullorum]|nr:DUF2088 domain-containing protein [Candidatus Merdisoma merdipullorum]